MIVAPSVTGAPPPAGRVQPRVLAKQNINVQNGVEAQLTLVADLGAKDKESEK